MVILQWLRSYSPHRLWGKEYEENKTLTSTQKKTILFDLKHTLIKEKVS